MSTSPYHHGALKQALVDEAMTMLARHGAEAVGLRELARAVGVSPAAPYRHFANRGELMEAVALEGFMRFQAAMTAAVKGVRRDRRLAAMGRAYIRFALHHPHLYRVMFSPGLDKRRNSELGRAAAAAFAFLEEHAGSRRVAIRAWSLAHGFSTLVLADQIPGLARADAEDLAGTIVAGASLRSPS